MVVTLQTDIDRAADAAGCVVAVHHRLAEFLKAGQTLAQVDQFVADQLRDLKCISAFLKYRMGGLPPFPSYACLSVNDCIVHGTHDMSDDPLKPGDIFSVDIGVVHAGWVGDAAFTYAIEHASPDAQRLMTCGRESLRRGIAAMRVGRPLIDWAKAVQKFVEKACGFHLIRGLGGHGYGKKLHGPPFVSNVVPLYRSEWPDAWTLFKTGQLLALEPMIAAGTPHTRADNGKWPIFTADGSLAVHYEANVIMTDDGPRNLTEGLDQLPDVVG